VAVEGVKRLAVHQQTGLRFEAEVRRFTRWRPEVTECERWQVCGRGDANGRDGVRRSGSVGVPDFCQLLQTPRGGRRWGAGSRRGRRAEAVHDHLLDLGAGVRRIGGMGRPATGLEAGAPPKLAQYHQ